MVGEKKAINCFKSFSSSFNSKVGSEAALNRKVSNILSNSFEYNKKRGYQIKLIGIITC